MHVFGANLAVLGQATSRKSYMQILVDVCDDRKRQAVIYSSGAAFDALQRLIEKLPQGEKVS